MERGSYERPEVALKQGLPALVLMLAAAAALGTATWEVKSVHGYKIALAVQTLPEPGTPGMDSRHAPVFEHRLLVSVREEASGKAAPIVSVSANVAEFGYGGETLRLSPVRSGDEVLYEGRARLETKTAYRILLNATPARGVRTLEAQFDYRHHH